MEKLLAVPFLIFLFLLAVACGSSEPTVAANPQSASEIKQAAVDFFDAWFEATENHDASAVLGLFSSPIRDQCTPEQMEVFFERDANALTYPDMGVKEVYLAAGNSEKAFVTMELLGEPQSGRQGQIDAYIANVPNRIVKEDGRWRLALDMFVVEEGCPFVGSYSISTPTPAESSTPTKP